MKVLWLILLAQALLAKVEGTVTNAVSQEPLKKVIVTLSSLRGAKSFTAESGSGGKFIIGQVPPGRYLITADRPGFKQDSLYREVVVETGDLNIAIRMNPLSAINGRITDFEGDPVRGATVTAMRYTYDNGNRHLEPAVEGVTDDRGIFRLFGLGPGRYYVRTSNFSHLNSSSTVPYVSTFFPSAIDPSQASSVALGIGSDARGIDITLRHEALHKVSGTLPPSATPGGYDLRLIPRSNEGAATSFPASLSNLYGVVKFVFDKVATGSYELIGTRSVDGQTLYGRQMVNVGGADVEGLSLALTPGFEATGKVIYEATPPGRLVNIAVRLVPVDLYANHVRSTMVKADGTFVVQDVPPAAFDIALNGAGGVYLKSDARVDFTRGPTPLTLVLASDFGEIVGIVKDENGNPVQGVSVTAIPSSGRADLLRSDFTGKTGRFRLMTVAPGDYTMFAWDHVPEGAPQNASFRQPYEKFGKLVHLAPKGSEAINLTVVEVAER